MFFFFFKQKTAYEMRISDWSSDVCSSDLAIAERECNIIGLHDLADFLEIIVEETLLVVSKAPFGHDGAAARYDAGNALRRHRNIRQTHARMDGEIIDALFGLLDQRIAEDVPGQILGNAAETGRAWCRERGGQ